MLAWLRSKMVITTPIIRMAPTPRRTRSSVQASWSNANVMLHQETEWPPAVILAEIRARCKDGIGSGSGFAPRLAF
jgi:hypothetical protein